MMLELDEATDGSENLVEAEPAPGPVAAPSGAPAMGPPTPWPDDHAPRTRGEIRLWLSFAQLREDSTGPLDVKLVATRIGMSRTVIAYANCAHRRLRAAVLDEILRRQEARAARELGAADRGAAAQAPVRGARYWQAIAQRADSRLVEFKAIAVREQGKSRRLREVLRRILADMREGRWTRTDADAVMLADIAAVLDIADRQAGRETGSAPS